MVPYELGPGSSKGLVMLAGTPLSVREPYVCRVGSCARWDKPAQVTMGVSVEPCLGARGVEISSPDMPRPLSCTPHR